MPATTTTFTPPDRQRPPRRTPVGRLLDARWRRRVNYPTAGVSYRSSGNVDLLRGMRRMMYAMTLMCVSIVAIIIAAIAGLSLPENLHLYFLIPAVVATFALNPHLRSVMLWQFWPRRAEAWTNAGIRFADLGLIGRSPLTPAQVHAYTHALGEPPETGVNVRLVWALRERNVSPNQLTAYITPLADTFHVDLDADYLWGTGTPRDHAAFTVLPTVEDILAISDYYTPHEWALLRTALPTAPTPTLLRLALWMSASRATLTPDEFPTENTHHAQPRSAVETAVVLHDWAPLLTGIRWNAHASCPHTGAPPRTGCPTCGGRPTTGHGTYLLHPSHVPVFTIAGTRATMSAWAAACGTLAPHFLTARFDHNTATSMCSGPTPPTVDAIRTLAALRNTPPT